MAEPIDMIDPATCPACDGECDVEVEGTVTRHTCPDCEPSFLEIVLARL